jgi:hypothetical protein
MFSVSNLFIGLAMVGAGVLGVKFTFQIVNMTGSQDWLERYTGSGSTYGVYKIVSVLLIFIGLLVATGFGDNFMNFIFSPLKSVFQPLGK